MWFHRGAAIQRRLRRRHAVTRGERRRGNVEEAVVGGDPSLAQELEAVLSAGARVTLVEYRSGKAEVTSGERYILTAIGDASHGVVHTFAEIVANRGGNFSDLSIRENGMRFTILAEIDLPSEVALEQLQIDLEHAGAETGLQVRLQHHRLFVATNEVAFRRIADDS